MDTKESTMTNEIFENVLATFGHHTGLLMTEQAPCSGKMGVGFSDPTCPDNPPVSWAVVPRALGNTLPDDVPKDTPKSPANVWDMVYFQEDGRWGKWRCHGNRCGGQQAYARAMAPVLIAAGKLVKE